MALSTISNEDILSKFFTWSKFFEVLFLITVGVSVSLVSESSFFPLQGIPYYQSYFRIFIILYIVLR